MLREHVNEIWTRWNPKDRRGGTYDPVRYLETPEQARKLMNHLEKELCKARSEKNQELIAEVEEQLAQVEHLSRKFFRWEDNMSRNLKAAEIEEIKKLPLNF